MTNGEGRIRRVTWRRAPAAHRSPRGDRAPRDTAAAGPAESIKLLDVYKAEEAPQILYRLLAEREKQVSISHKKMPTMKQHLAFVRRKPYKAWYLIWNESGESAGATYLSKTDEIGIFLFRKYRQKGYGRQAVVSLMKRYPRVKRFLANVNPQNEPSIRFFRSLGFRHIQNTYELGK